MGRILGLDFGDKYVGIAASDKLAIIAHGKETLLNDKKLLAKIAKACEEEEIEKIVVGRPRNMDGSLGKQFEKVKRFVDDLSKKTDLEIVYEDETNTSNLAEKRMIKEGADPRRNKETVNQIAAKIILQGYLNRIKDEAKYKE